MSRCRTTKRVNRARWTLAASLGTLLFAGTVHAVDNAPSDLRVSLLATSADGAGWTPPRLRLDGAAPERCLPLLGPATLDGVDLSLTLTTPASGCTSERKTTFNLFVDPALGTGLPLLPGQVYRVRVYAANPGGRASLVAFDLLYTSSPGNAPTPENGFWWSEASAGNQASPGTGIALEAQGSQLAISLFGFANSGTATWAFGSAQRKGRIADVPLVQLANGDPPFAPAGTQPQATAGPRLALEFVSPTRARAWLVHSEDGRDVEVRALTLARSRFTDGQAATAWSGTWVLVPEDGGTPRTFDFAAPGSRDAETFHLADTLQGAQLDCRLATGTRHPDLCTLSAAGSVLADFDQVGLDRLSGRSSAGTRVQLLRVPRS
ncbi:MAG: hypothetical protein GXC76_06920 [Rhodanobacteraceae bacterium]|jgi:hypothetical protein|nr:hypothetical protein [Rhodanobacteraceae bacterium]